MENITESNRLIAEFMGAKYDKDTNFPIHPNDLWLPIHGIVRHNTIEWGNGPIIKYHISWDWLMPVVNKITGLYHRYMYKCDEGQHYCEIWCYDGGEVVHEIEVFGDTDITTIYEAVVEFIQWYNQNKTS